MSSIKLKEPQLIARLERLANELTDSTEHVLEMAVRQYLEALDAEVIRKETEAFWAMHGELLAQYPDEHVAIHHAQVVDHDVDARRLETRIRERFGPTPVLIAPVNTQRELRWRGGHLETLGTA